MSPAELSLEWIEDQIQKRLTEKDDAKELREWLRQLAGQAHYGLKELQKAQQEVRP